ncbi:MAG: hypothetical protein ACE5EH_01685 [Gammaproteobacteria bacterium]
MIYLDYGIIIFIAYFVISVFLFTVNNDAFSPDKYFFLNTLVFYGEIFFVEKSLLSYVVVTFIASITLFSALSNTLYNQVNVRLPSYAVTNNGTYFTSPRLIWLLSFVALTMLASHLYIVNSFGGLMQYMVSLASRLESHQSFMILKIYSRQIMVIYMLFFCLLISTKIPKKTKYAGMVIIVGSAALILGMQGSRSAVLLPVLFSLISWHYLRRPISNGKLVIVMMVLLFLTSFLEVYRRNFNFVDIHDAFAFKFLNYGLMPIEIWENSSSDFIAYGSTLLAGITTLIPRAIWPGKPDSGGSVLNVIFADHGWPTSSITTGIFVEGFINFGVVIGLVFAVLFLIACLLAILRHYRRTLRSIKLKQHDIKLYFSFVFYILIFHYICNLHVQDFAYSTTILIVNYMILMGLLWVINIVPYFHSKNIILYRQM